MKLRWGEEKWLPHNPGTRFSYFQWGGSGFIESWSGYGSGSGISTKSWYGFGCRVLMTKREKLKKGKKQLKIYLFLAKITIYLSLGLHKGRPSYRRSLQPSNDNIFPLLDPDPDPWNVLNPDPQHWLFLINTTGYRYLLHLATELVLWKVS